MGTKPTNSTPSSTFRLVSKNQENLVKDCLEEFRKKSFNSVVFTSIEISYELPNSIIEEIVSHLPFIDSMEYLEKNLCIVDKRVMVEVMTIIHEIFEDIEMTNSFNSINLTKEPTPSNRILFSSESDYFSTSFDSDSDTLFY